MNTWSPSSIHKRRPLYRNEEGKPFVAALALWLNRGQRAAFCTLISGEPIYDGCYEMFFEEDAYVPPAA